MPIYIHDGDDSAIDLRGKIEMPKSDKTKRHEVHLLPETIEALKVLADKANRSLKNYMETVLIEHVKEPNSVSKSKKQ